MKETDLAAPVVSWLRALDWEVFQEVELQGEICDIVATRGNLIAAVELKVRLSFDVIEQAARWREHVSFTYAAVPIETRRHRGFAEEVCEWQGIGLLMVLDRGAPPSERHIVERVRAKLNRSPSGKLRAALCEEHKTFSTAGSSGAPRWTPFKETCRALLSMATSRPGISLKEAIDGIKTHYGSPSAARGALARWIELGRVPEIEMTIEGRQRRIFPAGWLAREAKKGTAES